MILKNVPFSVSTAVATFWATLEKMGFFLFQHLVTRRLSTANPDLFPSPSRRLKAHSHYCVFHVLRRQKVAFRQRDRKFPISVLTQPHCRKRRPLRLVWITFKKCFLTLISTSKQETRSFLFNFESSFLLGHLSSFFPSIRFFFFQLTWNLSKVFLPRLLPIHH